MSSYLILRLIMDLCVGKDHVTYCYDRHGSKKARQQHQGQVPVDRIDPGGKSKRPHNQLFFLIQRYMSHTRKAQNNVRWEGGCKIFVEFAESEIYLGDSDINFTVKLSTHNHFILWPFYPTTSSPNITIRGM